MKKNSSLVYVAFSPTEQSGTILVRDWSAPVGRMSLSGSVSGTNRWVAFNDLNHSVPKNESFRFFP